MNVFTVMQIFVVAKCANFIQIELNSILYLCEKNAANFCNVLGEMETKKWRERAGRRKELILKYFWNEKKHYFYDYDFKNNLHSEIASSGGFATLWANIVQKNRLNLL